MSLFGGVPLSAGHTQQAELLADDDDAGDEFGKAVALHGDLALIGARYDDEEATDAGAAYLHSRNQGGSDNWGQFLKLTASDAAADDLFGSGLCLRSDTAVVGAPKNDSAANDAGAVYIFKRNEGGADNWGELIQITASDAQAGDQFGKDVAVNEGQDTIIVGARFEDTNGGNAGAAYIFGRNEGGTDNWGQVAKLTADDGASGDRFGKSVTISGDIAVVGAWRDDSDMGAVYIFYRNEGGTDNWGQVAKIPGDATGDQFGKSLDLSGDTLLVGAPRVDLTATNVGAAYIFKQNWDNVADSWGQVAELTGDPTDQNAYLGQSVSLDGDVAIVGSPEQYGNKNWGRVTLFLRNEGGSDNWGRNISFNSTDAAEGDHFGIGVAGSNDRILVGANLNDDGGSKSGSAYIFEDQ
ncbi:MAG: hypothetical protein QNK37_14930 [Acidobacteriota bacterium]|nr:hypothetical protein [Acidobacteriota bacterium]